MNIDRNQVLQFLKDRGQDERAAQAALELPAQVDTDEHAGLLYRFGVNPHDLVGTLGGGISDVS